MKSRQNEKIKKESNPEIIEQKSVAKPDDMQVKSIPNIELTNNENIHTNKENNPSFRKTRNWQKRQKKQIRQNRTEIESNLDSTMSETKPDVKISENRIKVLIKPKNTLEKNADHIEEASEQIKSNDRKLPVEAKKSKKSGVNKKVSKQTKQENRKYPIEDKKSIKSDKIEIAPEQIKPEDKETLVEEKKIDEGRPIDNALGQIQPIEDRNYPIQSTKLIKHGHKVHAPEQIKPEKKEAQVEPRKIIDANPIDEASGQIQPNENKNYPIQSKKLIKPGQKVQAPEQIKPEDGEIPVETKKIIDSNPIDEASVQIQPNENRNFHFQSKKLIKPGQKVQVPEQNKPEDGEIPFEAKKIIDANPIDEASVQIQPIENRNYPNQSKKLIKPGQKVQAPEQNKPEDKGAPGEAKQIIKADYNKKEHEQIKRPENRKFPVEGKKIIKPGHQEKVNEQINPQEDRKYPVEANKIIKADLNKKEPEQINRPENRKFPNENKKIIKPGHQEKVNEQIKSQEDRKFHEEQKNPNKGKHKNKDHKLALPKKVEKQPDHIKLKPVPTGKALELINRTEKVLEEEQFVFRDAKILLAVSGGIDSMVMLDIIWYISQKWNIKLAIAHFNHHLRGEESNRDESFVNEAAKSYGLHFYKSGADVRQFAADESMTIEQAARSLRYNFLEKIASSTNSGFIATAHNNNDSVETFLINLFRGSGLTGLGGIPSSRQINKKTRIIRPLISVERSEIEEYARLRNVKWREDSTNSMLLYRRNKIRHELLPILEKEYSPGIRQILNRTSHLLAAADKFIQYHVQGTIGSIVKSRTRDSISVRIPLLRTFDDFMQGEILQVALMTHLGLTPVTQKAIDRLLELTKATPGSMTDLTGNYYALKDRDNLYIARKIQRFEINEKIPRTGEFDIFGHKLILKKVTKQQVKLDDNPNVEFFDMDLLPLNFYVKSWEYGMTFQPLGSSGQMKISDFLINQKVPLIDKQDILLLTTPGEVIWVCGMRISEKFKISSGTRNYLKAEFIK